MKQTIILLSSIFLFGTIACAQNEEAKTTKKVKIIIVDENGVKKEIEKEISGTEEDIKWTTDDNKVMVIVNRGDGKSEEIEIELENIGDKMMFEFDSDEEHVWVDEGEMSDKAFLGVQPAEGVKDISGVMVLKAVKGSAAEEAGMQTGDVITKIDSKTIGNFEDLKNALADKKPGDEVSVTYARQGKSKTKNVSLKSMDSAYSGKKVIIKKEVEVHKE